MSEQQTVAYIGPEYSFSHDLVRAEYPAAQHVACPNLASVVTAVAQDKCVRGLVPFYNTNYQSIRETQIEIIRHRGKVFVVDVLALKVRHYLCGAGTLPDIREVRTKSVVFDQASHWLEKKLPGVQRNNFESTSLAIQSLAGSQDATLAAIGTKSASKHYGVKVIQGNIQNKPNVTVFFVVEKTKPNPLNCDRVLMCIRKASERDMQKVEDIVKASGCGISSGWQVHLTKTGKEVAYFCELDGQYANLDLNASVVRIKQAVQGTFMVGGYTGKCITRMMI